MTLHIAYTDEVNTCDCCGKTPLKHTVAITDTDEGETLFLGSVCAWHYTGFRMTGNPHKAMVRFARHAATSGLTLRDIADGMAERQEERASARA